MKTAEFKINEKIKFPNTVRIKESDKMDNCRRKMTISIIFFIFILGAVAVVSASEAAPSHEAGHEVSPQETHELPHEVEHVTGGEEAGEGHGGEGEHGAAHGPPFAYWFMWVFLILTMATLVAYLRNTGKDTHKEAHNKETKYHSIEYAVTIGIFIVIVVTISLLPSVGHYHESTLVGFTRFLLMIITGFLLMAYGFREHERHKLSAHH